MCSKANVLVVICLTRNQLVYLSCQKAETDALKKTQEDLQKGRQKLDDMLIRLDKEQVSFV